MDQNLKKPLVSVTICTYNRAGMIPKAVYSTLEQTYKDLEIIIVDDASTDNTEEVVKKLQEIDPRIKYFKNPINLNIAGTRNETIKNSSGKYIAILDSDDFWIDNTKIERQVNFLEKNEEFALVGTNAKIIDQKDNLIGEINNELTDINIKNNLLIKNQFVHSTVLYKKEKIIENNYFNKKNSPFEDYDLILKIGRKNKLANLGLFSTAYREHEGGESKKINLNKKLVFLGILLKNIPYYRNGIKGVIRRLNF